MLKLAAPTAYKKIILGKIGAPYGIKGWIKIFSETEKLEAIFHYQPWLIKIKNDWHEISVINWKKSNDNLIAKINGFDDRDVVNQLKGCQIAIESEKLPLLPVGEYYWKDLIGCDVFTIEGAYLGKVSYLFETGANDVMVVQKKVDETAKKQKRHMIPFIEESVLQKIDITEKKIIVIWDENF